MHAGSTRPLSKIPGDDSHFSENLRPGAAFPGRGQPHVTAPIFDRPTAHGPQAPGPHLPRVYRGAVHFDEARALFMLQALTKANDAEDVRVESTKLKDYDIEG